jgi:5-methylcytosine-specific restriction endonuclease McrA
VNGSASVARPLSAATAGSGGKISEEARRLHPYCAVPGCTSTDLTVDHVDPRTRGKHGLTLADVQVLCRFHNSSKGAKSYRVEGSTTSEDAALWVL